MPKRTNPFGEHSPLQLKTHIRAKEVDQGVCHQMRMQSVFEKTHKMLFGGMNEKLSSKPPQPLDSNDNVMIDDTKSNGMRQMTLGKNCELLNHDEVEMEEMDEGETPGFENSGQGYDFSDCKQFSLADHGTTFGRNTAELSPPSLPASPLNTLAVATQNPPLLNVFQRMKMAQLNQAKKTAEGMCIGACHNCRHPVQRLDVLKCQFCENFVCGNCARQCRGCLQHFCQLCSMLNYDQSTVRAFCLSCSGH